MAFPFHRIPTLAKRRLACKSWIKTECLGTGSGWLCSCRGEMPGEELEEGREEAVALCPVDEPGAPPPQCPQIWPGFLWSGADSVKMVKGVPAPHHLCFCHGGWLLRAGQAGAGPFWLDLIWGQRVLESGGSRVGVRRGSAPRAPSRNCRLAVPGSVPRALPSPASLTCLDARGTRAVGLLSTREVHLT